MRKMQKEIQDVLGVKETINPKEEIRNRVQFIKEYVKQTPTKGYVLGISGGQDSTLAGKLLQIAMNELKEETGEDYIFVALRLPYGVQKDEEDAQLALQFIQADVNLRVDIKPAVDAATKAFEEAVWIPMTDFNKGNQKAQERMTVHYRFANHFNVLVAGTDHAAEAVTGFFTKYGDGGVDVTPLTGLTKRQGKELLKELGAPEKLYLKKPTADLLDNVPQQEDETELGITYDQIDDFLEGKDVPLDVAEKLEKRYAVTRHKRELPVTPFDGWWK